MIYNKPTSQRKSSNTASFEPKLPEADYHWITKDDKANRAIIKYFGSSIIYATLARPALALTKSTY